MTLFEALEDVTIRTKPDYRAWWHRGAAWVVQGLFWLLWLVSFGQINQDFNDFWTTLGDTIYRPAGDTSDLKNAWTYAVLCHELAHYYDDEAQGWKYRLSYIASGRWRAFWEMRGYGMQMVAFHRATGGVPPEWPTRFAKSIAGPAYLWAGDEAMLLDTFQQIRQDLLAGRLDDTQHHPDLLNDYL